MSIQALFGEFFVRALSTALAPRAHHSSASEHGPASDRGRRASIGTVQLVHAATWIETATRELAMLSAKR